MRTPPTRRSSRRPSRCSATPARSPWPGTPLPAGARRTPRRARPGAPARTTTWAPPFTSRRTDPLRTVDRPFDLRRQLRHPDEPGRRDGERIGADQLELALRSRRDRHRARQLRLALLGRVHLCRLVYDGHRVRARPGAPARTTDAAPPSRSRRTRPSTRSGPPFRPTPSVTSPRRARAARRPADRCRPTRARPTLPARHHRAGNSGSLSFAGYTFAGWCTTDTASSPTGSPARTTTRAPPSRSRRTRPSTRSGSRKRR